jgi:hypothetical protein
MIRICTIQTFHHDSQSHSANLLANDSLIGPRNYRCRFCLNMYCICVLAHEGSMIARGGGANIMQMGDTAAAWDWSGQGLAPVHPKPRTLSKDFMLKE